MRKNTSPIYPSDQIPQASAVLGSRETSLWVISIHPHMAIPIDLLAVPEPLSLARFSVLQIHIARCLLASGLPSGAGSGYVLKLNSPASLTAVSPMFAILVSTSTTHPADQAETGEPSVTPAFPNRLTLSSPLESTPAMSLSPSLHYQCQSPA